jgi:hypothetical protein
MRSGRATERGRAREARIEGAGLGGRPWLDAREFRIVQAAALAAPELVDEPGRLYRELIEGGRYRVDLDELARRVVEEAL